MITRRAALLGIGAALAAPAVVRADSLMKIVMPKRPDIFALLGSDGRGGSRFEPFTSRYYIDIQSIRNRNVLLTLDDYASEVFRNIPIQLLEDFA